MSPKRRPRFSVILVTRNNSMGIRRCLRALARQTLPREMFEVLVVDNASTDRTCAMVHAHLRCLPELQYYPFHSRESSALAMKVGAQKARGEWLVYVGDECVPPSVWLAQAHRILQGKPRFLVAGGPVLDRKPRGFQSPPGGKEQFPQTPEAICAHNLFIRRKVFLASGGLPIRGYPGDQQNWMASLAGLKKVRLYSPHIAVWRVPNKESCEGEAQHGGPVRPQARFFGRVWVRRLINRLIPCLQVGVRRIGLDNVSRVASLEENNPRQRIHGIAALQKLPRRTSRYSSNSEQRHVNHPRLIHTPSHVSPPAFRICLQDARVAGPTPAIMDRAFTLVKECSRDWGKEGIELRILRSLWLPPQQRLKGWSFMAACLGGETYFHWMTDVLPMLLLEKKSGRTLAKFRHFLVHPQSKAFHLEALEKLGIAPERTRRMTKKAVYRCENLVAHTPHHASGRPPAKTLRSVAELFLPSRTRIGEGPKRLMILRGRENSRFLQDREAIIEDLSRHGFVTYEPAMDSIVEQARAFRRARVIVATHGAALTNLIFCRPGTLLIELFSAHYVNPCYAHIARQLGIRHISVIDSSVPNGVIHELSAASEPIRVTVKEVQTALRQAGV